MNLELKQAIITWLFEHEHDWQRIIECKKVFKQYIYDDDTGAHIIGGKQVSDFINNTDELIYKQS